MERPVKSREQRLANLLKNMTHVPPAVKARFQEAFLQADPNPRGMPKALEAFYAQLRSRLEADMRFGKRKADKFSP